MHNFRVLMYQKIVHPMYIFYVCIKLFYTWQSGAENM